MKLSEIAKGIQKYIDAEGDTELNGVDILHSEVSVSVIRMEAIDITHDGRKVVMKFIG